MILLTPIAPGRTRHVPSAYPTIKEAVDAAENGDIICVSGGPYVEPQLSIQGKTLLLYGLAWGEKVVVNLAGSPLSISNGAVLEFHDFYFTQGGYTTMETYASTVTLARCTVMNGTFEYQGDKAIVCGGGAIRIHESEIIGCDGANLYPESTHGWTGLYCFDTAHVFIQHSEFVGGNGTSGGVAPNPVGGGAGASAIRLFRCPEVVMRHCTATGGGGGQAGGPSMMGDCANGGSGGHGIHAADGTHLDLCEVTALGGPGGGGSGTCSDGPPGAPVCLETGSEAVYSTCAIPTPYPPPPPLPAAALSWTLWH
jgi:hypothetical protein